MRLITIILFATMFASARSVSYDLGRMQDMTWTDFGTTQVSAVEPKPEAMPEELVFTYVSTYPATIKLASGYAGPANPSLALYNTGAGWVQYTSKTITLAGPVIKFKGDWRNSSGTWQTMFGNLSSPTFPASYPVVMTGGLVYDGPLALNMFNGMFISCAGLVGPIPPRLFGRLTGNANYSGAFFTTFQYCTGLTGTVPESLFADLQGVVGNSTFRLTFSGCANLTSVSADLFEGITGLAGTSSFFGTFQNCNGLKTLPSGLFRNVTGTGAQTFYQTFAGCTSLSGAIPDNFFGSLYGSPGSSMFTSTFEGCTSLTSIGAAIFGNLAPPLGTASFSRTFYGCSGITSGSARNAAGQTLWTTFGNDNNNGGDCYLGCVNMSDYASVPLVWR